MTISAYTTYYNFRLIDFNSPRWHTDEWANWQQVDAALRALGAIGNKGIWVNGTAYLVGDRVIDSTNSLIYQCAVAHTSAATGIFSADRTLHPTYWTQVTTVPNWRGTWTTAVVYNVGDIVNIGNTQFYYALTNHTASGSFNADLAALKWTTVFDYSGFTSNYYPARAVETNLRPDGTASVAGDVYYNTASSKLRYYRGGGTWADFNAAPGTASGITFTPTGGISSTDVQAALAEVDLEKATIASPTLTGVPAAPTAAVDTNTTQLATTAYVINQGYLKSATASATYLTIATAGTTYLAKLNDLSDLNSAANARTNLSVYSQAQVNALGVSNFTQDVQYAYRNRLINGALNVNNYLGHNNDTTPVAAKYCADQWKLNLSQSSKVTFRTVSSDYAGSPSTTNSYYGRATVASAFAVAAADFFMIIQPIEGLHVSDLAWGTASAQSVTISGKITSSISGTFGISIRNSAALRSYVHNVVCVAGTPLSFSFVVPGDTSGTWLVDGGVGLYFSISLGSGSNFNAAAVDTWSAGSFVQTSAQTQWINSAAATFKFTDIQLEVGSKQSPFERRPQAIELPLCYRYYWTCFEKISFQTFGSAGTNITMSMTYPTGMRAVPTVTVAGTWTITNLATPSVAAGFSSFVVAAVMSASTMGNFTLTAGSSLNFDATM
jgi:hypothetical protein